MTPHLHAAAVASLAALAGCANAAREVVPDPSAITVEAALTSVMKGLRAAEIEAHPGNPGQSLGLNPCTVNVVFNITAGGTNKNELVVDANIKGGNALVGGTTEAKDTLTNESAASRGNQISVLLTSTSCTPKDTLAGTHPGSVGGVNRAEAENRHRRGMYVYGKEAPRGMQSLFPR